MCWGGGGIKLNSMYEVTNYLRLFVKDNNIFNNGMFNNGVNKPVLFYNDLEIGTSH